MNKYSVAVIAGILMLVGIMVGRISVKPERITITETKYIEAMVPVEVVREIEVPVPGKPVVIEKIVYRDPESATFDGPLLTDTGEYRAQVIEVPQDVSRMKGKIDATLKKEIAQLEGGVLVGWSGDFTCSVSFGEEWLPLVTRHLSREHTTVTTTMPVAAQDGPGALWRLDGGYGQGFGGGVVLVGVHRALPVCRSRWCAPLPDSVGAVAVSTSNDAAIVGVASWSF